jgi:hypothetical protein
MTCNPRVVHLDGQWQAWCKAHNPPWESEWTTQWSLAIHWANQHKEAEG